MMKKFKKIAAMAASMLVLASGMTALNSNAIYCAFNGDRYQEELERINNECVGYNSYPELCEIIQELQYNNSDWFDPNGRVVNVWLNTNIYDEQRDDFIVDFAPMDKFFIYVDVLDKENITPEMLKQEIIDSVDLSGMIDYITTDSQMSYDAENRTWFKGSTILVSIKFSTENHDENYLKCKEITSLLKEKYDVKESKAQIDIHEFYRGYYCCNYDFGNPNEEEIKKINESFTQNGFNVHLEKKTHPFSGKEYYDIAIENLENITELEKYEIAAFIYRNYEKNIYGYYQTTGSMPQTIDLLNLSGDTDCDGKVNINDAILVMQSIANPDKYKISEQGKANADIDGNGITLSDALAIQEMAASHLYD